MRYIIVIGILGGRYKSGSMGHDLPAEVEASPERISKGQSEQRKLQALMP